MADSSRLRGWKWDGPNGYLEVWVDGTRVAYFDDAANDLRLLTNGLAVDAGGITVTAGGLTVSAGGASITGDFDIEDGSTGFIGVRATPGTNAGQNWLGIEDGDSDPTGTLTNSLALYTPDSGDSLDFLHADGTTDSLGT